MRQIWSNLHQLGQSLLSALLLGIIVGPFWRDNPGSPTVYYIASAASLLLSTLLFYLIWRTPRWGRWNGYRVVLLFIGSCQAVSYLGWMYASAWGLSHLLGHILGTLVGAALGVGIMIWEDRAINIRKGSLLAEPRGALDA